MLVGLLHLAASLNKLSLIVVVLLVPHALQQLDDGVLGLFLIPGVDALQHRLGDHALAFIGICREVLKVVSGVS